MLGGLAALALATAAGGADIEALISAWSGTKDSSEAVTAGGEALSDDYRERRIVTLAAPLPLPWLGPHVIYLEEFPYDEPEALRRQLLIRLEPAGTGIRARLYTLARPAHWAHLDRRPELVAQLTAQDLQRYEGCDLLFTRQGLQFHGATTGQRCLDESGGELYVEYQLVLDPHLYWYRRRLMRVSDGTLQEEVAGFNWFELNEARLFACRIDWSASGRREDLRPLVKMDLHDKGGQAQLLTPDGRRYVLSLHSQDWPFAAEHGSMVLLLQQAGAGVPLAAAWAVVDDSRISLQVPWLRVRCGALEAGLDEVRG